MTDTMTETMTELVAKVATENWDPQMPVIHGFR
jgi:hypothetical protein